MGLRPANAFGGAQLPRIADDKLVELCLGTLIDDDDTLGELVEASGRLRAGGILSQEERDKWTHVAGKAGLLPRKHTRRPREAMAHDEDRFSTLETSGTEKAETHLTQWARPGGKMPVPPGRKSA